MHCVGAAGPVGRLQGHRDAVGGAAWSLHKAGDPAAKDWVAVKALAVLADDSDRAATWEAPGGASTERRRFSP